MWTMLIHKRVVEESKPDESDRKEEGGDQTEEPVKENEAAETGEVDASDAKDTEKDGVDKDEEAAKDTAKEAQDKGEPEPTNDGNNNVEDKEVSNETSEKVEETSEQPESGVEDSGAAKVEDEGSLKREENVPRETDP